MTALTYTIVSPWLGVALGVWMGKLDTVINLFKWHMAKSIS